MSRYIVVELEKAGIGIASATYDIIGFPRSRSNSLRPARLERPLPLNLAPRQGREQSAISTVGSKL